MTTEQFSHRKAANAARPGVVLVHQAWGDPYHNTGTVNNPGNKEGIQRAGLFSTAPYRGPDDPSRDPTARAPGREKRCKANDDTCKAWATNKYDGNYCNPHGRKMAGEAPWPNAKARYADAMVSDG